MTLPTTEQRLADLEATVKILMETTLPEVVRGVETRMETRASGLAELLPLQVQNAVDAAVWRIEAMIHGISPKVVEVAMNEITKIVVPVVLRLEALEAAQALMEDKLADMMTTVGNCATLVNPSTIQVLALFEVLLERGLLEADFVTGLFAREKAKQAEIEDLKRLWEREHGGEQAG